MYYIYTYIYIYMDTYIQQINHHLFLILPSAKVALCLNPLTKDLVQTTTTTNLSASRRLVKCRRTQCVDELMR